MARRALITGARGQDGVYLAELLHQKGYEVHGLVRREPFAVAPREENVVWHLGDLTDSGSISTAIAAIQPDEIYNLAAQSHVAASFMAPEHTANTDALGTLRILEALRASRLFEKTRFYQASSSELFGDAPHSPQTEETPFNPQSPYAISKLFAYWAVVNYRRAYGLFGCNGILYNHESPLRPHSFVVRKITRGLTRIKLGQQKTLVLGNLDVCRDWGHARDYVVGMWKIMQLQQADDFILASGISRSVRQIVETAASILDISLRWDGNGVDEKGINAATNRAIIEISPEFYRPTENFHLVGNANKAKALTGWHPETSFEDMIKEMVEADLALASG